MKSMPSVMSHSFSQVPAAEIQRSTFNRSHGKKTTFDSGYLVPVLVDEVLPGDTYNVKMTSFARLLTPIVPIMDNLYCDSFFFFVPNRLVWTNWKKFNGEQINPGDSISYSIPQQISTVTTGYAVGSLQDQMGIPPGVGTLTHSALPLRMYNLIYNEWFRDQNLQNSVTVDTGDGPDTIANYTLLKRGKRHDYFTSCLTAPQKGTAVSMPLGTSAPVRGIGLLNHASGSDTPTTFYESDADSGGHSYSHWQNTSDAGKVALNMTASNGYPTIYADLSGATAATINQLRQSFQVQRLLERDMRGGTRYTEIIRAHFGVVSPDARLQRPEYLGGNSVPIKVNPVAQTSGTSASGTTTPLGNLAAIATMAGQAGFVKSFTEHGFIIGLISVRADLNYQQGLQRFWSRSTRYDYYWPALSHIGEQSVLNKEIYAVGDGAAYTGNDAAVFGYQERYAEYRYFPSLICGKFRSQVSGTLDIWHLAQKFTSLPTLGSTFIVETPPISRVVAVNSQPEFQADFYFDMNCTRPMPAYSVPGLIDHF